MQRLTYYLFYLSVNLFRLIPFWLLSVLSWKMYVVLYYMVGYRKKVVIENLTLSFPEKSDKEIKAICKNFYKHNLAPVFVEGIKGFTMSDHEFLKRFRVLNPEILLEYYDKGQDVIALASHYTNWEWGIQAVDQQIAYQAAALYKPLSNKYIEQYSKQLREKSGMKLVSIQDTRAFFESKKEKPVLYIMAADQFPGGYFHKAIWLNFLDRDTAWLHGPESYSRYNKLPVVYFNVQRKKRGYYTLEIVKLVDNPEELAPEEVTRRYVMKLEEIIRQKPENWLWSHKRWKRPRS